MNDEQHGMAPFQAQPCRTDHFSVLRRYGSLECNKHTTLTMPCKT
jgi:hypothetical protein